MAKEKKYSKGTKVADVISNNNAIATLVDGEVRDLSYVLEKSALVKPLTFDDETGKHIYWHSTAHVMAQAVKRLFPDVKLGIGPAIEDGFYYDFDSAHSFTPDVLNKIEKEMNKIIKEDHKFVRKEVKKSEAVRYFKQKGEEYKLELLKDLNQEISLYSDGDFADLCQGPHIPSAGKIGVFKLIKIAGAYWKGNENNPMLQRVYGVSYPTKAELDLHLEKLEEAKARDHRKLGKELGLFSIFEDAGPGLVCWQPKGTIIRQMIENFWKDEHEKRGYQLITTPHIAKANLWRTSGHFDFYEHMTTLKFGNEDYVLKPMNCIYHILLYNSGLHSYRELPIRYAELGTVYRCEKSGVLHGLMRPRGFTQDDAHIFCREDQVATELTAVLELSQYMMQTFGFNEYQVDLSVRDPDSKAKYAGSDKDWQMAEKVLTEVVISKGLDYRRIEGEAVFYGPKIDISLVDALGRPWQGSTIQFDFNLPKRFNITYVGKDNTLHPVLLIHRTVLGSMERFIGCLIEHYKGAFPVWLSPVQVMIATISQDFDTYARQVAVQLQKHKIRIQFAIGAEKIGAKIRESILNKIPYTLVVGEKEQAAGSVSVRNREKGEIGSFKIAEFIKLLERRIEDRS